MGKAIKTGASSAPKVSNSQGKRIFTFIIFILGIVVILYLASTLSADKQEYVSVIRLKSDVLAGQTITENLIEEYKMPKAVYDTAGVVPVADENGDMKNKQVYLLWSQKDDVLLQYASNYMAAGTFMQSTSLTQELTVRNPWIQDMKADEEIFTISFNASSVNSRLLYPGTRLRARLIQPVPIDVVKDIRDEISKSENTPVEDIVKPSTVVLQGEKIEESQAKESFQVAEIIIDEITITDMTNSAGESIYDLYMSLLKLPINKRIDYLRTTLGENSTANAWASRVTPTTITYILDKESASRLAEFEQSGGTIKYTILPDDPTNEDQANLMSRFVELSNQINTVIDEG